MRGPADGVGMLCANPAYLATTRDAVCGGHCVALEGWCVMAQRKPDARDATSKPRARDLRSVSSKRIHWDDLPSVQLEAGIDQPLELAPTKKRGVK